MPGGREAGDGTVAEEVMVAVDRRHLVAEIVENRVVGETITIRGGLPLGSLQHQAGVGEFAEPSDMVEPMRRYGEGNPFRLTGSTHDEGAYITKNAEKVGALNQHLIDKIEEHRDEIEMVDADPDPGADTLVIAYGVTAGAARAAIAQLRSEGIPTAGLVVQSIWPIPETALAAALDGIDRVIVPELNMGLYRREIERLAGKREILGVNRVDGTLITVEEIVEAVR